MAPRPKSPRSAQCVLGPQHEFGYHPRGCGVRRPHLEDLMAKKRSGGKKAPSRGRKTGGRSGRKGAAKRGGRKTSRTARKGSAKTSRARKGAKKTSARKGSARKAGARKGGARKAATRRAARPVRAPMAAAGIEEAKMAPMTESMAEPMPPETDLLGDTDEDEM